MVEGLIPVALEAAVTRARAFMGEQSVHRYLRPLRQSRRERGQIASTAGHCFVEGDHCARVRFWVMEERDLVRLQLQQLGCTYDKCRPEGAAECLHLIVIVGNQS